jgi:hypothetical protein
MMLEAFSTRGGRRKGITGRAGAFIVYLSYARERPRTPENSGSTAKHAEATFFSFPEGTKGVRPNARARRNACKFVGELLLYTTLPLRGH